MSKDEEVIVDSMNIDAGCEFDNVIDIFEEKEHADGWFWKDDWMKCDDATDTFEEEEGIDDSAIELLKREKDALNFL